MEIYSELIRLIEEGKNIESSMPLLYSKITHSISVIKAELELLNFQEKLLQVAVDRYISLAKPFQNRSFILKQFQYSKIYTHMNDDLTILMNSYKDRREYGPGTEKLSMLFNNYPIFSKFSSPISLIKALESLDYKDIIESKDFDYLSKQINAERNMVCYSYTERMIMKWLVITFDWVIEMRKYPFLTNFREIEKLVNKDFPEFAQLENVQETIRIKQLTLKKLEKYELIILKFKKHSQLMEH